MRRTRGFFRERGRERKGGIMVTEFGQQIPVKVAAKYDETSGAEACCGPYLGLGEKRPPSNPAQPCGKGAARAGCVQRNIHL